MFRISGITLHGRSSEVNISQTFGVVLRSSKAVMHIFSGHVAGSRFGGGGHATIRTGGHVAVYNLYTGEVDTGATSCCVYFEAFLLISRSPSPPPPRLASLPVVAFLLVFFFSSPLTFQISEACRGRGRTLSAPSVWERTPRRTQGARFTRAGVLSRWNGTERAS